MRNGCPYARSCPSILLPFQVLTVHYDVITRSPSICFLSGISTYGNQRIEIESCIQTTRAATANMRGFDGGLLMYSVSAAMLFFLLLIVLPASPAQCKQQLYRSPYIFIDSYIYTHWSFLFVCICMYAYSECCIQTTRAAAANMYVCIF